MQQSTPLSVLKEMDRVLSDMLEMDRGPFLAWLEHRARGQGDLAMVRVIREYRVTHGIPYPSRALD
jgi:hypothetical protein